MAKNIDKLIINSPYEEPEQHWFYISTLLLNFCHKKQENYNEKLATNFVGGYRYIVNTMSWAAGSARFSFLMCV